ncbi:MAG: DUF222 domain-containing protein [Pseudonocardiaceae bacterium]|nr:DUF222 domain-containing protein [Pseudonocardiaceae bacterium]
MIVADRIPAPFREVVGDRARATGNVGGPCENVAVTESPLRESHRLLEEAMDALSAAAGPQATDVELESVLTLCEGVARRIDRLAVGTIAELSRRGTFAERGYKTPAAALSDLLGWERFEARRRVVAAEQVCPRVGIDGTPLPAMLPVTAEAFAAGQAGLRHVEAIAKVLATAAADRLAPEVWAGAETELAGKAAVYTPAELASYGTALVEALDADGAEPDDRPAAEVNELFLTRHRDGSGGRIKGRFDDPALYDAIATVVDAHAKPAPPTTAAAPESGRPTRWPRSAVTCSTTATCTRRVAAARI